jgi:hypothetical protein
LRVIVLLRKWPAGCCSVNGRPVPDEPFRWENTIDEKNERRERDERDVQRRSHLHGKREIVTEQRYGDGEHEAAQPRIRRRARIRDHEEGEDQQRPALELMQRDRERVAEPNGPHQQEGCMRDQKEDGDVEAVRRAQHEDGEKAQKRGEPYRRSPLSRRNPHAVRSQKQNHDREACGIPDVLAVHPKDEFRADRNDSGNYVQPRLLSAQQQAQREAGDQGRAGIELRQREQIRAERLRCQRPANGQQAVEGLCTEINPEDVINEQSGQRGDLIMSRIGPPFAGAKSCHRRSRALSDSSRGLPGKAT